MKILLLEDNRRLNNTIVKRFKSKNFTIDSFLDGQDALNSIDRGYDCFVLDINVPSIDGLSVLKYVKDSYPNIPVLIISSSVELESIKGAYNLGCDDYIKKPFYIDELELKIEKLCNLEGETILLSENTEYNIHTRELFFKNESIKLTKKERLLLNLFIKNLNKVVSFEEIQSYVWHDIASVDSIRSLVMKIRKKLPENQIETLIDVGYRLNID